MKSINGINRWGALGCALLLGAGCNAFDDPTADSGSARLDPAPEQGAMAAAGSGAIGGLRDFDNAQPTAPGGLANQAAPTLGAVPLPPPFGFGASDTPSEEWAFVNREFTLSDGHLRGQLPGAALDGPTVLQSAHLDGWAEPGNAARMMTFELHAHGLPGAGMIYATVHDVAAIGALLRGPDESVEGEAAAPTAVTISAVEVTGCSGPELHNYDWDQHTNDGEMTLELDPEDPDTVRMRATGTWDDGTVRATAEGSATFSRSQVLPLLEELEALEPL